MVKIEKNLTKKEDKQPKRERRRCQKCLKFLDRKKTSNRFYCPQCHKIVSEYIEEW